MKNSETVHHNAEHLAEQLLQKYEIKQPHVDVDKLAEQLGIQVQSKALDSEVSGTLYRHDHKALIVVNSSESPVRKRFTVAHEIGHYMMHKDQDIHIDSNQTYFRRTDSPADLRESEANQFAAALLMPKSMLEAERELNVEKLAKKYKVSAQAMTYRLINLQMISLV